MAKKKTEIELLQDAMKVEIPKGAKITSMPSYNEFHRPLTQKDIDTWNNLKPKMAKKKSAEKPKAKKVKEEEVEIVPFCDMCGAFTPDACGCDEDDEDDFEDE